MYAIVETGGKQYRVAPGDTLRVESLPADSGATVELDKVLMVNSDEMKVGAPFVDGAKVICTVLEHGRGKKLVAIRYKAKKNVRVRRGHRQNYSCIRIESIEA